VYLISNVRDLASGDIFSVGLQGLDNLDTLLAMQQHHHIELRQARAGREGLGGYLKAIP
jgi:hypothetical protein